MIKNEKGTIWYGCHFYPGVAEYQEPGKEPYRIFLNEDTIRSMDPSFAGRPVFVNHVDGVDEKLDELRKEADGWVMESFYNKADGKHWVKFIVVTDRANKAIQSGMRPSNCYIPTSFNQGGIWNGLEYDKEITGAEFEHLAIVKTPRYEESQILTPEQFKAYNASKILELERLANHKEEFEMKFKFFKRAAVENSIDIENTVVVLPKTKREVTIAEVLNEADQEEEKKMAHPEHMVDVGDEKMNVGDLVKAHMALKDEMKEMKDSMDPVDPEPKMNDEDEEYEKEEKEEKKKNELDAKRVAKEKADAIRNASDKSDKSQKDDVVKTVETLRHQLVRGSKRYGSGS